MFVDLDRPAKQVPNSAEALIIWTKRMNHAWQKTARRHFDGKVFLFTGGLSRFVNYIEPLLGAL